MMKGADTVEVEAARRVYGATERGPVVYAVAPGSPAETAGMMLGDTVLAIDGWPLPAINGPPMSDREIGLWRGKSSNDKGVLRLLRGDQEFEVSLTGQLICEVHATVIPHSRIRASTNGSTIRLTSAMLDFARTDDELAIVVGHELAHAILLNTRRPASDPIFTALRSTMSRSLTTVSRSSATQRPSRPGSVDAEKEADALGTVFAAWAGYDASVAPNFWRRMAVANPGSIQPHGGPHPSTPERFVALEALLGHLQAKQTNGVSLLPGYKDPDTMFLLGSPRPILAPTSPPP